MIILLSEDSTDLDTILDLSSIVSDNEGWLHDSREVNVVVTLVLPLKLVQQRLVGGLRETEIKGWERGGNLTFTSVFIIKSEALGKTLCQRTPVVIDLFRDSNCVTSKSE